MSNIVLFPKTEEYYEQELTRFLQTEQYEKAAQLLSFLLQFPNMDGQKTEQWHLLLQWLQTMFPEVLSSDRVKPEEEITEEDLFRQVVNEKSAENQDFTRKLLTALSPSHSMEQQLQALEQLTFVEHPDIDPAIKDWLTSSELHPLIQFKALQTLKQRGVTGYIHFYKKGSQISVEVEETPLTMEGFPSPMVEILERVEEISETDHPDFGYFAKETWHDFLAYAYGTSFYTDLLKGESSTVDLWASGLHAVLFTTLFGADDDERILELYGITSDLQPKWSQIHRVLRNFTESSFSRQK